MFTLKNVSLHGTARPRLDNVSLSISGGRIAIVGYSGAGKTSLLNLLAGFERCDSGTLDRNISGGGRLPLYWVPQNGGLWPHLTVLQHLQSVDISQELSDEILRTLDLEHRRAAVPDELSQGERSRVALGRALASGANVLLMDEPLSHVDPVRKPIYWRFVRSVIERLSAAVVFSTHEPETVLRHSDQVIGLHEGGVMFQGTTNELYDSPPSQLLAEFLGPVNWFSSADCQIWNITTADRGDFGIRPERIRLTVEESSNIEFLDSVCVGPCRESLVRNITMNQTRTVKHLSKESPPRPGQRIVLRVT